MINKHSPVPVYSQLSHLLLQSIRAGDYPPGARVPSEHELGKKFKVGRPTVRQALDLLVKRGILRRSKGSGTFVCEKEEEIDLYTLGNLRAGKPEVQREIIGGVKRISPVREINHPLQGREVFFFLRRSLSRGKPVLLEEVYLDGLRFPGAEKFDFAGDSLARIIEEEYHLLPLFCTQTYKVLLPGEAVKINLNIEDSFPLLALDRSFNFDSDRTDLFSRLYCCTQRFDFSQKIGGFL